MFSLLKELEKMQEELSPLQAKLQTYSSLPPVCIRIQLMLEIT